MLEKFFEKQKKFYFHSNNFHMTGTKFYPSRLLEPIFTVEKI